VHPVIGENLDSIAVAVDPLVARVHAAKHADLGHLVNPLPMTAGYVLGVVDLMARP
jgi:hypothetical protein